MTRPHTVERLDHDLSRHFPELAQYHSKKALEASGLYRRLQPDFYRILGSVVQESCVNGAVKTPPAPFIRATAWNIERGLKLDGILETLRSHPDIRRSDVFLLTELDYGMARTQNRHIVREIAAALHLDYVFAPSYINLSKGAGLERRAGGDNTHGLHGHAILSRYPLYEFSAVALPNGRDKMKGREKRLGDERAVVATVDHPLGPVRVAAAHLDAHSSQKHRGAQMKRLLDHLDTLTPDRPTLIGGDWNTSTYNSHNAFYAIVGFWRRVLMGVDYTMKHHYARPDAWFERHLFRELERRGFRYRDLNEEDACTLHYHIRNVAMNSNMSEWVPQWCYRFIDWSLKDHDGLCSFKLDWFAGRGVRPVAGSPPRVVGDLRDGHGPLSDHDAIVLDFVPDDCVAAARPGP